MDPFNAKLVAAAVGSTLTALTMTPFDVIKTRLQTQRPPVQAHSMPEQVVCVWEGNMLRTERVNGFIDAVQHVVRAEGVRGLWKGAGTSLLIGVPASTTYMLSYHYLLHDILPPYFSSTTYTPLVAGVLARTTISTALSPLELIRTNLQSTPVSAGTPHTLRSVLTSVRAFVSQHGVRYLWRGLAPTLWRDVPFSGCYWAGYEYCKRRLEASGHRGVRVAFVSGAISGIFAALLTGPLDTLKTRQQAFVATPTRPQSILALSREIVRHEGVRALYAGLGPRMAKIAPACGLMIACFEGFGSALARKDLRL